MNSAEQCVRTMAEMISNNGAHKTHLSVPEFIAQYGREWEWRPKPNGVPQGTIKLCFENAFKLARRDRSLTYVEGYATHVIPVHHAWVVTPEGIVIDNTWAEGKHDDERAYFGVAFDLPYVTKRRREMRDYGGISVLDDWANKFPTLRRTFEYNQRGVRPANF